MSSGKRKSAGKCEVISQPFAAGEVKDLERIHMIPRGQLREGSALSYLRWEQTARLGHDRRSTTSPLPPPPPAIA